MELDRNEWLRRENHFLREQNDILKIKLKETKECLEKALNKLALYENKN